MKMQVKSFINNNLTSSVIFILIILLSGCKQNMQQKDPAIKITHGNLIFEVNSKLETRFSSTFPDSKPVMDKFQSSEKIIIDNEVISDFEINSIEEKKLSGGLSGKKWIANGIFQKDDLKLEKRLVLIAYDDFPNLISVQVTYTNASNKDVFVEKWINNSYTILSQEDEPPFWAFQGSSSSKRSDWIKPLEPGYYQKNFMGMNDSDYGGGIPVTCVWRPDISIAVGHLAPVPKLVSLPTEIQKNTTNVEISVSDEFADRTVFKAKDGISTLETFISISQGDYYANLAKYSELMQAKGIKIAEPEEAAFESVWCAWGYGRQFTLEEIVNTLPKVKELGITWVVLDDGFQIAQGNWNANREKFPKGNIEIKKLVDKIHSFGLKAKIWWTPLAADPGGKALQENPEMLITRKNGAPQFITWWDAYYLSPTKEKTLQHTKKTLDLFLNKWDFDGLKMDGQHMNAVALDYSLEDPQKAPEGLPDFFQMIYDEARKIKPHAVIENCPCGTCMSYFNMASTNQTVSSDPMSSWQIRHKGKTYKALVHNTAYYGDHVELSDGGNDFASSFGVGAVLGTKFTWPKNNPNASGDFLLTPEKEKVWKKWFGLYNKMMLSKGDYLGKLYDIGYDKPETHVIKKNNNLYYAFYADSWNGKIELRGLKENTNYILRDYFNNIDIGKVNSSNPFVNVSFKQFLLIEAAPN